MFDKLQMFFHYDPSWNNFLQNIICKTDNNRLWDKVIQVYDDEVVYPPKELVFNAFNLCTFNKLKVVIIGQDPYHGIGQAQGLSFSVPKNQPLPPSLKNIYKELYNDLKIFPSPSGDLSKWAEQGVLLLNSSLTVKANKPNSHSKIGWEQFTDQIIAELSEQKEHLVFILWGNFAQKKIKFINQKKHLCLLGAHPSPLGAYKGFFNQHYFSRTNEYLMSVTKESIDWDLNENY
jgi:uracil-DNA glycosylase